MACVRLGWLLRVQSPDRYRYAMTDSYYLLSAVGRETLEKLRPDDFVSLKQERPRIPPGELGRVLRALANRHNPERGWLFLIEAALDAGSWSHRVDALALNLYASQNYRRVIYEVKLSRSDFFTELRDPEKTRRSAHYASSFFFACPEGLVKPSEVPDPYGLVVVKENNRTRMVKRCKELPAVAPSWATVGRLLLHMSRLEEEHPDGL